MIPLTDTEKKYHICKEEFWTNEFKYKKVWDHCHYAAHSICNLRYKVPKNIQIVIHNHSTYHDHFIMKQELECLGENTEKYISEKLFQYQLKR